MNSIATQLADYGVPLVGLNVLLQQLGLPIPAGPTMMLAGALAVAGRIDFVAEVIEMLARQRCWRSSTHWRLSRILAGKIGLDEASDRTRSMITIILASLLRR